MVRSFFFSSRRRHTRLQGDWSSDVCSSDLVDGLGERDALYSGVVFSQQIVGSVLNPSRHACVGRTAVSRVVFEAAVLGRVVRWRDDDAIGEVLLTAAVVDQDGPRDHGRRRHAVTSLDYSFDVIGRQDLDRGTLRRAGQRVRILAHVKRTVGPVTSPVVADCLSDGQNVSFGERARQRGASMSARAEADHLVRVTEVGPALKIFALEPGHVDQHLFCGRPASKGRDIRDYVRFYRTGHGLTLQILFAYSAIVRSLENLPEPATFKMALCAQASGSVYNARSRWSASR